MIETWFPLGIYIADLAEAHRYRQQLLDAILDLEQKSGTRRNYPGIAWTGDIHQVEAIHRDQRFAWIRSQVESHTRHYLQELGLDLSQVQLYLQRSWPILSRPGEAVPAHCHPTAHVSAVYYIAVEGSEEADPGSLVFIDDARFNEVCPGLGSENTQLFAEWNGLNLFQVSYPPAEGRILIFPAKQRHEVTANQSEALRVSLSFDIAITAVPGQAADSYEFLTPAPEQWQRFNAPPA